MWCRHGSETEFGGRNNEPLVYKDFSAFGHERDVVVIIDFPKLSRDAQVVITVMGHELVATDLVPFSSGRDFRRAEGVDAQANRGSPRSSILHELHPLAVISEEKRTGRFQTLFRHHLLISLHLKLGAHCSIRPNDAHNIGTRLFAKPKMKQGTRDRLFLQHQTGTNLHFTAHAKRIDALVAACLARVRSNHLPVIVL